MSILIKGMEMPKRCVDCKLKRDKHLPTACIFRDWQSLTVNDTPQTNEWCPIVEIPPHGRLIDADALLKLLDSCMFPSDMVTTRALSMATNWLKEAQTVIPADKDGET